jgi:uncharacterized membrane protein
MSERENSPTLLILAYLPLLGFIPLIARKAGREVRWHAKNGLLLFGVVVVIAILATLVGILVPPLSCLYGIVMVFVAVAYVIVVVLAIVKALQGERVIVPGISRYVERF